ncbi:MAG: AAA family ATPase [Gemmatimonadota bacterium]|nr:AAA family ATPase [Gemmatimonadota bacterium]
MPYPSLARMGFALRRGQLGMMVAAPGGGKSVIAQDIAMRSGAATLYCCPDTDEMTMAVRAGAKLTGYPQAVVEQYLRGEGKPDLAGRFFGALESSTNVRYAFDVTNVADIGDEVFAYGTLHGAWPELVIVDNLANVHGEGESEFAAWRQAMDKLHKLARHIGAHVLVLHHATGQWDDGDRVIPLSGIEQKLSKMPAQVLTLYRPRHGRMGVAVVKNRGGAADSRGSSCAELCVNFDNMQVTDPLANQEVAA